MAFWKRKSAESPPKEPNLTDASPEPQVVPAAPMAKPEPIQAAKSPEPFSFEPPLKERVPAPREPEMPVAPAASEAAEQERRAEARDSDAGRRSDEDRQPEPEVVSRIVASEPPKRIEKVEEKPSMDKSEKPAPKSQESIQESITARFGNVRSALGVGTIIQGKLSFDTPVRIDGKLTGEIYSTTALIVGPHGVIDAKVEVAGLVVMGVVKGTVRASGRIELLSGGNLQGDISTPVFVMEEGALFNGDCNMLPKETKQPAPEKQERQERPQAPSQQQPRQSAPQPPAPQQKSPEPPRQPAERPAQHQPRPVEPRAVSQSPQQGDALRYREPQAASAPAPAKEEIAGEPEEEDDGLHLH